MESDQGTAALFIGKREATWYHSTNGLLCFLLTAWTCIYFSTRDFLAVYKDQSLILHMLIATKLCGFHV